MLSAAFSNIMPTAPLPPRPDPQTGEPRPPAAPLEPLAGTGEKHPERGDERYLGDPPPGMGPTLEGCRFSTKSSLKAGAFITVVCLAVLTLYAWVKSGNPLDWAQLRMWWVWLVILAVSFGIPFLSMRGDTVTCGADWVKKNRTWVELYELTHVKVKFYGVRSFIELIDHADRKLSCDLVMLQTTPLIWDYVYNGILHSVANGNATTNSAAIGKLDLPLPKNYTDD